MAAKHAQRELVDSGLQESAEIPAEEGRPVVCKIIVAFVSLPVVVQEAIRVGGVDVIVILHQREQCFGHIAPLVCLR